MVVHSVIVHETATGYAQCFRADVENEQMGVLRLADFEFSEQVQIEWTDPQMFEKMKNGVGFTNPHVEHSVRVDV